MNAYSGNFLKGSSEIQKASILQTNHRGLTQDSVEWTATKLLTYKGRSVAFISYYMTVLTVVHNTQSYNASMCNNIWK